MRFHPAVRKQTTKTTNVSFSQAGRVVGAAVEAGTRLLTALVAGEGRDIGRRGERKKTVGEGSSEREREKSSLTAAFSMLLCVVKMLPSEVHEDN